VHPVVQRGTSDLTVTSNLLLIFLTGATTSHPLGCASITARRCDWPGPPFQKEWTMPGQEIAVFRAQDEPGEGDPRRSRSLVTRSDRPIVSGSIALLTALAFVLARWQMWAKGDITGSSWSGDISRPCRSCHRA
jgi:hypothetical protein